MQQAVGTMKSQTVAPNKLAGLDFNRGRSGRWGLNVTGRKSQAVEISVQRIVKPTVAEINTQSFTNLKAAVNLADPMHAQTRTKRLTVLSKPRQRISIALPPISGSRAITGKAQRTDVLPANRQGSAKPKGYSTLIPTGKMVAENKVFNVLYAHGKKVNQESNKNDGISVAGAGNKAAIQDSESHSRPMKPTFDSQPASTAAPVDPPVPQKNDARASGAGDRCVTMLVGAKHDASPCEVRQQRDFFSDDWEIETESESSSDKGGPERLEDDSDDDDDEYYTDQRITEWVLKVNSSLFSTGNDELERAQPAEEQDVATIKIYYGD